MSAISAHSVVNTRSSLARGLTYAEIADKLTIRPRTAETRRANLMRRLDPDQRWLITMIRRSHDGYSSLSAEQPMSTSEPTGLLPERLRAIPYFQLLDHRLSLDRWIDARALLATRLPRRSHRDHSPDRRAPGCDRLATGWQGCQCFMAGKRRHQRRKGGWEGASWARYWSAPAPAGQLTRQRARTSLDVFTRSSPLLSRRSGASSSNPVCVGSRTCRSVF
jgi:Bacterial regulatory proteins, luxR family